MLRGEDTEGAGFRRTDFSVSFLPPPDPVISLLQSPEVLARSLSLSLFPCAGRDDAHPLHFCTTSSQGTPANRRTEVRLPQKKKDSPSLANLPPLQPTPSTPKGAATHPAPPSLPYHRRIHHRYPCLPFTISASPLKTIYSALQRGEPRISRKLPIVVFSSLPRAKQRRARALSGSGRVEGCGSYGGRKGESRAERGKERDGGEGAGGRKRKAPRTHTRQGMARIRKDRAHMTRTCTLK